MVHRTVEQVNAQADASRASFIALFNKTVEVERGRKTKQRFLAEPRGRMLSSQLGRALNNIEIIRGRNLGHARREPPQDDFREGFQRKPEGTRPTGTAPIITRPEQTSDPEVRAQFPTVPINPFTSNPIIKDQERKGIRLTRVETIG